MPAVSYDAVCLGLIKFHAGFKSTFRMSAGSQKASGWLTGSVSALSIVAWLTTCGIVLQPTMLSVSSSSRCTFIALIKLRTGSGFVSCPRKENPLIKYRRLFAFTSASDYIELKPSIFLCAFFIFIILHACHKMWHIAPHTAPSSAWHMTKSKHKGFHLCKCLDESLLFLMPPFVVRSSRLEAPVGPGSHSNWNFCAVCTQSEPTTTCLCPAEETNVI